VGDDREPGRWGPRDTHVSHQVNELRACLGGLRLHQTNSGAATPPICSSTVELDSPFGAEEMCLAETTTPAPKNEDLNRLPSFALFFFSHAYVCAVLCVCVVACVCCVCMLL
jgi:hypothetical protein